MITVEDFVAQLEPFGVTGVRFGEDGQEDELAVCCPESRRLMDCTVDMYAIVNGTQYCVALPIFSPVAICYHKGERLIPVENECELMDRLYDFLAPTLEQEDLFLIRSPVCLTLDGDLGDLGEDGEFSEEELAGWEEFDSEEDPWQDGEEEDEDEEDENKSEPLDEEIEKLVRMCMSRRCKEEGCRVSRVRGEKETHVSLIVVIEIEEDNDAMRVMIIICTQVLRIILSY